ncbi:hypothetical protein ACN47E_006247 [Coniothyrium glycines]
MASERSVLEELLEKDTSDADLLQVLNGQQQRHVERLREWTTVSVREAIELMRHSN